MFHIRISGCCCVLPDSIHVPSLLDISVFPVRAPDFYIFFPVRFIFHQFRMFPTSCSDRSIISGIFRHSYFIIVSSFPDYSVAFPSFMFHHFRNFPSFIFHHCFIISGLLRRFSVFYVPSFPEFSVILISSFPDYSVRV